MLLLLKIDYEATLPFTSNHDCTNMLLSAALEQSFKVETTQHTNCVGPDIKGEATDR